MDDTAQISSVQNSQQPVAAQTDPAQQTTVTQPQPVTRPVEPPQGGSRGPEGGPVKSGPPQREAAPIDEADAVPPAASDDSSDVIDDPDAVPKAVEAQAPAEVVQEPEQAIEVGESHPQVEVSEDLKQAGVQLGPDAQKDQLPEEKQQIGADPTTQPVDPKQVMAQSLPMDYVQSVQLRKQSKIRDSAKWLANMIKRQWEIIQGK